VVGDFSGCEWVRGEFVKEGKRSLWIRFEGVLGKKGGTRVPLWAIEDDLNNRFLIKREWLEKFKGKGK